MGDTQMLKPQASKADMAAGSTFAAAMPNIQLAAPAGNSADNTLPTASSTIMTAAEALPVIPSESNLPETNLPSTADSGLALDSTLTPLTESLSLPQIELPVKGAADGAQAPEIAPLPVSGAGASAAEKAGNPLPEAIDNHLQSLSGLSDQLKALNGEIESVSDEESADFSATLSEVDTTSAASQPELPTAPLSTEGLATSQPTSQAGLGKPEGPIAQFTSTAAQPTEQVVDGALYSVKNGHKELIIRLNPDNLGEVRINLISHGNQEMSARLIASTRESHELLQSQVDSLKQSLESQGLNVERLSVILAGSPESTRDFNQQSNQQQTSQHSSQQSGQQQAFNQQGQPNPNLFNQFGQFQHKQGFAQQPGEFSVGGSATTHTDGLTKVDTPAPKNDNGRISILA
jgi:flagellar hook-length control protein FliK